MNSNNITEELYYAKLTKQWFKAKYITLENGEAKLIKDILITEQEAQEIIARDKLTAVDSKFHIFYNQ